MRSLPRLALLALSAAVLPGVACSEPPDEEPASGGFIRRADGSTMEVGGAQDSPDEAAAPAAAPRAALEIERRIFELTNDARRRQGSKPLRTDKTLTDLARGHSADMLLRGFFAHVNPDGKGPADRIAVGHRRLVGENSENVWTGSGFRDDDPAPLARRIFDGWMSSPGHRQNILRAESTHLGVGVIREDGEVRATQKFATVWAWLEPPLPRRVSRNAFPEIRMRPYRATQAAKRFDLVVPGSTKAVIEPVATTAGRLEVTPGTYRIRLFFPKESGGFEYWLVTGPELVID